jgi:cobalt-zinc-cadmium resistance protein CzcA
VSDITNVQVQMNTEAPGYSPIEAKQHITYPVELALAGRSNLDSTRSLSRYVLSQVTVVFEERTDIYFARQQTAERLPSLCDELPRGLQPEMGPIAMSLGEIFICVVEADRGVRTEHGTLYTPIDLHTVENRIILP